ncbi:glycosyltransferase [Halegenticoccus soli]|uniref:glycosyltransferase n=1 Tax=Halegenticoccus soli TaxID=1985678 RepID=UPI000C6D0018|nr:glycosyltransferase family A protein [Halegenticoccus soli]
MVSHSIAVCNYNMADTIERSLRSMLDQVDDRFEVVVVDGGSDDGSVEIVRRLADEYDALRLVALRPDPERYLGADRNRSFEESRGEYVLESLDTDDYYFDGVIEDFVEIYHQLESQLDFEFFLSGTGINAAPRSLLLDVPYYNLGGAEDRDLWRRLLARGQLVWLDHGPVFERIGYHKSLRDEIRRDVHGKVCDFQSGISLPSCLSWAVSHERYYILEEPCHPLLRPAKAAYHLVTFPYAYLLARGRERHDAPPGFERRGTLERVIHEERRTLSEIEARYGVEIDRSALSETGREVYDL